MCIGSYWAIFDRSHAPRDNAAFDVLASTSGLCELTVCSDAVRHGLSPTLERESHQ
jgi:hypothetical protein